MIVNNNLSLTAQYNQIRNGSSANHATVFEDLVAASLERTSTAHGVVATGSATTPTSFSSRLNDALSAYGIDVPPVMRVLSGPHGLQLTGDDRNARFQAMLKDRPDIRQELNGVVGTAMAQRKNALDGVMAAFAGPNPGASIERFLVGFEAAQKPDGYSVTFNGTDIAVEEKGDNGWELVRDKQSFMTALLQAYTEYLNKYQVRTTSDDDSDANREMAQKLDDAKDNAPAAV